jgi:hypothetical protein
MITKTAKTDEQLLAEANALDAAYAGAEIVDLRHENEYLRRVLLELVLQVKEDFPEESCTSHLCTAIEDAEEALGLA